MDTSKEISEELKQNYKFDGTTYTYIDKETNKEYKWDLFNNAWVEKVKLSECPLNVTDTKINIVTEKANEEEQDTDEETEKPKPNKQDMSRGVYGYEGDTYIYTDAVDGTVYFWDKEKNAWFPKIDDTFIAYYQMSYGFSDTAKTSTKESIDEKVLDESKTEEIPKDVDDNGVLKRKATQEPPKWFDVDTEHNTKIYVTNLPLDITEVEFIEVMQKCGLVMRDPDSGKMKVKLYTEPGTKHLKGDALCTYIKKESVDLALNLLDGYDVRGQKIKVERARFTMKGEVYDPNLKPKKKRRKDKEKIKKMQERLFAWQPDKLRGERPKNERVVVIKNLFDPAEFDENLSLILEYRQDIRDECAKCGSVKKVVLYDKHQDGVAQVWFKEAEAADACIQLLNNRWFNKRLITAETWDGNSKYKVEETPEEAEVRLKKWEEFLNAKKEPTNHETNSDTGRKTEDQDLSNDTDGTRSSAGSEDETDEEMETK